MRASDMDSYPLYDARGSAWELGYQHGTQAGEKIRGYAEYLAASLQMSMSEMQIRTLQYMPLFDTQCPILLEEIKGLAEGAQIPVSTAVALQLRGELGQSAPEGCTTFVIGPRGTASGETLIGQTSDTPAEIEQFAYGLRLTPIDRPALLMWTFGGMLGYHGINQHGVGHFANALGGGPAWRFALSHYPLKRLILEQHNMGDVLALMRRMGVCSNGNYVLCDGAGQIGDVELTSEGPHVLNEGGAGFMVHSNHYLCSAHACDANFAKSLPDSFPRLERIRALVQEKFGKLTAADVQVMLTDHSGHPAGICRHPHEGYGDAILPSSGKTVAAIVAEPAQGKMHIARGNPCENPYITWQL